MKKNKNQIKIKYDLEADVLSWELSQKGKIDHAAEMENVIVHFSKKGTPLLIEMLSPFGLLRRSEEKIKNTSERLAFSR